MVGVGSYNDALSTPILATKLYVPPPRPKAVLRPRLIDHLNAGLNRKLTLISAAAGSGKTTLLSAWLATCGRPVAWLSLDDADNDLTRFLTYVIAALQTLTLSNAEGRAVTLGETVLPALQSPQPPSPEAILTALLNDIAAVATPFVLVLDDYHVIDTKPIDDALTLLIERLPPHMHLVIATREDPPLPLARLRVRDQLTELRAADLRFTPVEATDFLNRAMGLTLSGADIAALETRTEGWIAGLQLAALSMRGRENASQFVQAFAGNNRYIVDYLVEEVLQRQPAPVRHFLLQTALLDQLSGPLCDAVTGQGNSSAILNALERGNLFVVPLDDQRHWFRYHHLFADVLAAHLQQEQPAQIPVLHQRASAWYAAHDMPIEAVRHALAARDFECATGLIEMVVPAMRRSRQEATLLGWLKALPDPLLRTRPVLSVAYAWALLTAGESEGVESRLRDAEQWLAPTMGMDTPAMKALAATEPTQPKVVVDDEAFRRLPGSIAVFRAGQALALGDVPETITQARRALKLVPEDDHLMRGAAASLLGIAAWTHGDLEAADQGYADGMTKLRQAGNVSDAIGCSIALADIRIEQGHLHAALQTYDQALQLATTQGGPVPRGTAGLYVGISDLHRERNHLQAANQHLLHGKALGEFNGLPHYSYRWRVALARIRQAEGDLDGALELLDEAAHVYVSDFLPNVHPIAALKTRVWLAQGRVADALGWVRKQGLTAHDGLSYLREFEHITLARVLLARHQRDSTSASIADAIALLNRLLHAAVAGARTSSLLEILILQALAFHAHGDPVAALTALERALTQAEPEGYVRLFVDEGQPMVALLDAAAKHRIVPKYVYQLLTALGKAEHKTAVQQGLIVPLSDRELEVLRLFGTDLSGPEIARELIVSLSTLRTHTKNIYNKLEVNDRRAAVRRAAELGL